MSSAAIVQKLWNYCNVLRDDGMSYGNYPSTRTDPLASLRAGPSAKLKTGPKQTTAFPQIILESKP